MAMSAALKGSPQSPFLMFTTPGGKRKGVSSAVEVGQSVVDSESTCKKARRGTNQNPVPCSSLSSEEFDHEDINTGKEGGSMTAEPQREEDAEAELSASVPPL